MCMSVIPVKKVDLNRDSGCIYWDDCFTCVLPKCILDMTLFQQIEKIEKNETRGARADPQWIVPWDWKVVRVLAMARQPNMVKEALNRGIQTQNDS